MTTSQIISKGRAVSMTLPLAPSNLRADRVAARFSAEHQRDRDTLITAAVADGRIPESRRQHYTSLFDASPTECWRVVASLFPALAGGSAPPAATAQRSARTWAQPVVTKAKAPAPAPSTEIPPGYPAAMLSPHERERIAIIQAGGVHQAGGKITHSRD
jgi:hypothetical protein